MTRMRWRTEIRSGNIPGQPANVITNPKEIPSQIPAKHVCGWCGGPNSHLNRTARKYHVLCRKCMRDEFGSEIAYDKFIRSQIARHRKDGRL